MKTHQEKGDGVKFLKREGGKRAKDKNHKMSLRVGLEWRKMLIHLPRRPGTVRRAREL